jgi:ParB-like chromosome segregation protein Spo0J
MRKTTASGAADATPQAPPTTTTLRLDQLVHDRRVQVREVLDDETVERYSEATDLPPVAVVDVPQLGYLLTDGWHRVAAAAERGDDTIEATVTEGTLEQAIEAACLANVRHGLPLTTEERNEAIVRLDALPKRTAGAAAGQATRRYVEGWTQAAIAAALGCSRRTVDLALKVHAVREHMGGAADALPPAIIDGIGRAPEPAQPALAELYVAGELRNPAEVAAVMHLAREQAGGRAAPASAQPVAEVIIRRGGRAAAFVERLLEPPPNPAGEPGTLGHAAAGQDWRLPPRPKDADHYWSQLMYAARDLEPFLVPGMFDDGWDRSEIEGILPHELHQLERIIEQVRQYAAEALAAPRLKAVL